MAHPRLTTCELELMDVLWTRGESTVQEVRNALQRPLAYTTVMTMLSILEGKKGVLDRTRCGRAYVYKPVVSRDDVSRTVLGELRQCLFSGSLPSLVLNLLQNESLSSADVEQLKDAIDKLEPERQP